MKGGPYSHFDFVVYLLSGLVIVVALDLATDNFGDGLIHNVDLLAVSGADIVMILAGAYLCGHVNSLMAHWVLQEGMTSTTLGRPSEKLLFGNPDSRIAYFHPLKPDILERIERRAKQEFDIDLSEKRKGDDREVFKRAHGHARRDENFVKTNENHLMAFNFSRNMTWALFMSVIFLCVRKATGPMSDALDPAFLLEEERQLCWVLTGMLAAFVLVAIRYLLFLRSYTKSVLTHYARGETAEVVEAASARVAA